MYTVILGCLLSDEHRSLIPSVFDVFGPIEKPHIIIRGTFRHFPYARNWLLLEMRPTAEMNMKNIRNLAMMKRSIDGGCTRSKSRDSRNWKVLDSILTLAITELTCFNCSSFAKSNSSRWDLT
jgi:hypothetical protein